MKAIRAYLQGKGEGHRDVRFWILGLDVCQCLFLISHLFTFRSA